MQQYDHADRDEEGHQHPSRQGDAAEGEAGADVGRGHRAVVGACGQYQRDLGDEQHAEEESEALQGGVAAALEADVIEPVEKCPQHEEGRRHDEPGHHRIQPELAVQLPGREGANDDEGGMRQVRNVEHAEGDGDAERHGGIEAAQQHASHDRVQDGQWIEHPVAPPPILALFVLARMGQARCQRHGMVEHKSYSRLSEIGLRTRRLMLKSAASFRTIRHG
jgi:hypothetical protein